MKAITGRLDGSYLSLRIIEYIVKFLNHYGESLSIKTELLDLLTAIYAIIVFTENSFHEIGYQIHFILGFKFYYSADVLFSALLMYTSQMNSFPDIYITTINGRQAKISDMYSNSNNKLTIGDDIELWCAQLKSFSTKSIYRNRSASLFQNSDESLWEVKCERTSYIVNARERNLLDINALLLTAIVLVVGIFHDNFEKIESTEIQISVIISGYILSLLLSDIRTFKLCFGKVFVGLFFYIYYKLDSYHFRSKFRSARVPNVLKNVVLLTVITLFLYFMYLYLKLNHYFCRSFIGLFVHWLVAELSH